METLANLILFAVILLLSLPITVLFLECLLSLFSPNKSDHSSLTETEDFAILIPAHNEEKQIEKTLSPLVEALEKPQKIVVIADNCEDNTASLARQMGVTVLERNNLQQRGKGYALDYGISYLANSPPSVVVMLDADCYLSAESLNQLVSKTIAKKRPIQGVYLLEQPSDPTPRDAVSGLAFLVKNWVRPLGLSQVKLPCLLTGTGMAFPWSVLEQISLASGNIVEDMQLGIDCAIAGYPPLLAGHAKIIGYLPSQDQAATSQRTRWEHGHLQTILEQVPRLIKEAIKQKRVDLFALGLELSVPPLSLLVLIWLGVTLLGIITGLVLGNWWNFILSSLSGLLLLLAIFIAWYRFGREQVSLQILLTIPFYILWKIPLYFIFLVRPQKEWVRTERDQ